MAVVVVAVVVVVVVVVVVFCGLSDPRIGKFCSITTSDLGADGRTEGRTDGQDLL